MFPSQLPGADLVEKGLLDLHDGRETVESLLVSVAAPRLQSLGVPMPQPFEDANIRLYKLLAGVHGSSAHSRYNALVRRIVSYARALACAR
jgi:hypothetical protein